MFSRIKFCYKLFVLIYTNQDNNAKKFKTQRYYLPKEIIDNTIGNGKKNYDQPIDSNITRYEEIRKLTTGKGEHTNGCLLCYDYIKNNYILIAVDLSRQKESEADPKAI